MTTYRDKTLVKNLFYHWRYDNEAHFLICNKHKQLLCKNSWQNCSIIYTNAIKHIKKNQILMEIISKYNMKISNLVKALYDIETYNLVARID